MGAAVRYLSTEVDLPFPNLVGDYNGDPTHITRKKSHTPPRQHTLNPVSVRFPGTWSPGSVY